MTTPENQPAQNQQPSPNHGGGGGGNLFWSIFSIVATLAVSYFLSGYIQRHFDWPLIVRWIIIIAAVLAVSGIIGRMQRRS